MRSSRQLKVDSTTLRALEALVHVLRSLLYVLESLVCQIRKEIKESQRGSQSRTASSEHQLVLPWSDITDPHREGE